MTRPKGFVQIRLAKHRAIALAGFLDGVEPVEQTVLGAAGMSPEECSAERARQRDLLSDLRSRLRPATLGRKKGGFATYNLPTSGIIAMVRAVPRFRFPRAILPVAKKLALATRRRRGPDRTTGELLRNRIENGLGDERHLRRLRARQKDELARAASREADPAASQPTPLSREAAAIVFGAIRI